MIVTMVPVIFITFTITAFSPPTVSLKNFSLWTQDGIKRVPGIFATCQTQLKFFCANGILLLVEVD